MRSARRFPATGFRPRLAWAFLVVALASGCGGSSERQTTPAARLLTLPGSRTGEIVLTKTGAQRIGIRTSIVLARGREAVVPYSALVYAPDGSTYTFVSSSALVFREVRVRVDRIEGAAVYLASGPKPGSRVVTVGAEELFGVQTGVLGQT